MVLLIQRTVLLKPSPPPKAQVSEGLDYMDDT